MKSIYDLRNLEKHEDLSACMLRKLPEEFIREFRYKIDQKRIRISKLKISFHEFIRIYCNKICIEGTKMYLKIWDRDTKISWNDFIEKYPNINDISWVYLILYVD